MRVVLLISGSNVPSARYRILAYKRFLESAGHDVLIRSAWPALYTHKRWLGWRLSTAIRKHRRERDIAGLQRSDIVVIERQLFDDKTSDFECRVRDRVSRLVYDVDDAIYLDRIAKFETLWGHADHVIAGNSHLASVADNSCSSVSVIPTCVDIDRFRTATGRRGQRVSKPIVLGWIGTSSNAAQLVPLQRPMEAVARTFDVVLNVVCDLAPERLEFLRSWDVPVRFTAWSPHREVELIDRFDIGLMPLEDTEWNRGKCGFKLIQYMSMEKAAIASGVGVNVEISNESQAALIANSDQEWRDSLLQLCGNEKLRRQLGERGACRVRQMYSVQANADSWISDVCGY